MNRPKLTLKLATYNNLQFSEEFFATVLKK